MTLALYQLQLDALTIADLRQLIGDEEIGRLVSEGAIDCFQAPSDGQTYYFLTSVGRG